MKITFAQRQTKMVYNSYSPDTGAPLAPVFFDLPKLILDSRVE
jgi:hypothetical protein